VASPFLNRRQALLAAGALASGAALAQPGKAAGPARSITIAQIVDTSPAQQDVSKDFLIGSRAAWQDINSRGGLRGRPVQHVSMEVDGTAASVAAAVAALKDNLACAALSGTAGDLAAGLVAADLRRASLQIAHAAPWLQNSSTEIDERTFPIFAGRQEQIAHALKSLSVMSVQEAGVVYASQLDYDAYHDDLGRTAAALELKVQSFRSDGGLARLGQRLTPATPAILLFVGGTPELVQFTQGLSKQSRQRYVIALADVNLQTLVLMGAARDTPVIATQAVPLVNTGLPVVRAYRDVLSRLFDEPPTPLGLAGFIAARYTFEVLNTVDGIPSRQAVLAAFQRRASFDIGGFRVDFGGRSRGGSFVTQSMLSQDGRVIG
jgi:ABC-type branched-subunit amino acid transport system substrate-binding protein